MKFFLGLWASKIYYKFFEKNKEADRMGIVALTFDDLFLKHIAKPKIVIAVTGTNGKTTTCNLLNDLFTKAGYKVAFNSDGCNLRPGLSKALILNTSIFNKPKADVAILEFDELSTKYLLDCVNPDYVIVTNLFMDTMGRNGHTDYVFNKINEGLPKNAKLILNSDDLISSQLGNDNEKVFFSFAKQDFELQVTLSSNCDMKVCPNCYSTLKYDFVRYHHIGKAHCDKCGFTNYPADFICERIEDGRMIVNGESYKMINDSLFNVYNQLAALTLAKEFGITNCASSFESMEIVKSRYSSIKAGNVEIIQQMTKGQNPVSLSRAMDYVSNLSGEKELIIIIDDVFDKRSTERSEVISYIYDTDYECLNKPDIKKIIVAGVRSLDYKVRILMAGVDPQKVIAVEDEIDTVKYIDKDIEKLVIVNDMYQDKTCKKIIELAKEVLV